MNTHQHIASIVDATMIFASAAERLAAIAAVELELVHGINNTGLPRVSKLRDMHSQIVGCLPTYLEIPTNA